jgi:GrpB-like predicted nucleotidyltransferase (UPF0157 family)
VSRNRSWNLPPPSAPVSDEYLAAVTVGERNPLDAEIRLAAYDPGWPAMYSWAAERIRTALGDKALVLEHVGSTSVPGLAAKPIIDMVLGVADAAREPSYIPILERQGFELRVREVDWFEHRFLRLVSGSMQWHLHVFSAACEEIDRMLAFRDWLRAHADDRRRYEDVKRELASHTWKHMQHYADAKSGIVREILGRALVQASRDALDR